MRRLMTAASLAGLLVLTACGSTDPGLTAGRSDAVVDVSIPDVNGTMPPPSSIPPNPNNAVIDVGDNKEPQPYDEFLQASVADVQDYWRATYPEIYGEPFAELTGGIWASYPDRQGTAIPEGCRGDPAAQYISEGNAFYCSNGDYMAYDDFFLIPALVNDYGQSAVGVVFAHEFGHAIQARVGAIVNDPVVYGEQQSDCFAGAWTAHVARGESATLTFDDDDIRAGLSAMVAVKDNVLGVDVFSGNAHGTAFDRVGAFENGFIGGALACMAMETTPLPLLNLQFGPNDNSTGNTPYDATGEIESLEDLVVADLTRFWTGAVADFTPPTVLAYPHDGPYPECADVDDSVFPFGAFYCPSANTLLYDDGFARALYRTYGDFSVGYIISNAWSDAAQTQLDSGLSGEERVLTNECLTGAWTKDIIPNGSAEQTFTISPGDLDEAVETALILGTEEISADQMGSSFEKIEYFRAGVLGGVPECNRRITADG
ncbi:MAG: neutral zinc metallopeptidase [Ilumatobacteraceae bacterium]